MSNRYDPIREQVSGVYMRMLAMDFAYPNDPPNVLADKLNRTHMAAQEVADCLVNLVMALRDAEDER